MNDYSHQEALWKQWRKKPSKKTMAPLLDAFDPMIKGYVSSLNNNTLPRSAVENVARQQALQAFDTYRPGRASLGTHVGSHLRKANRYVYENQAVGRLPEGQILRTSQFRAAYDRLDEKLGRQPTGEELSRELKWSPKQVARVQRGMRGTMRMSANPLLESLNPDASSDFEPSTVLKYVYADLTPEEQLVFEYTFGYAGKPALNTNREIARRTKFSESKVRNLKKNIYRHQQAFQ